MYDRMLPLRIAISEAVYYNSQSRHHLNRIYVQAHESIEAVVAEICVHAVTRRQIHATPRYASMLRGTDTLN